MKANCAAGARLGGKVLRGMYYARLSLHETRAFSANYARDCDPGMESSGGAISFGLDSKGGLAAHQHLWLLYRAVGSDVLDPFHFVVVDGSACGSGWSAGHPGIHHLSRLRA